MGIVHRQPSSVAQKTAVSTAVTTFADWQEEEGASCLSCCAAGKDQCMLQSGDLVTLDGATGVVYKGRVPLKPAGRDDDYQTILKVHALRCTYARLMVIVPDCLVLPSPCRLPSSVLPLLPPPLTPPPSPPLHQWADKYKRMSVLANAETAADVAAALDLGAEGFGLFRTEHMFFR
jgi:phosphoenolpyruvate synthase/pyruvate phosphate dikinase